VLGNEREEDQYEEPVPVLPLHPPEALAATAALARRLLHGGRGNAVVDRRHGERKRGRKRGDEGEKKGRRKKMMWGPHVSKWREECSRGSLDYTKIRRPVSGPKSIKYVENGTSQAKNEL